MSLKNLTNAEMVKHGGDLLLKGTEAAPSPRDRMEKHEALRGLVPGLERAHFALLASQPASNVEVAKLTELMGRLDARHDTLCRAIDQRLLSELSLAISSALREALEGLRGRLFPTGMSIVSRSFAEEAGEVELREARMTAQDRKLLSELVVHDKRTLEHYFDELQSTGRALGDAERRWATLRAGGEVVLKNADARAQFTRAIAAIAAVIAAEGLDEELFLGELREAEAKADLRAASEPVEVEPTDPGIPPEQ